MASVVSKTCSLCEALCGLLIEVDEAQNIGTIKGNPKDVLSRGHICPKAVALKDIHQDPDRVKHPMRRQGNSWTKISWKEAHDEITDRFHELRERQGRRAIGLYLGNPNVHNFSALMFLPLFSRFLGAKNRFSATSADQLPHMFAAHQMFGHQLMIPIPDIDHTDHFVILGGNPIASNGSIMTSPDIKKRLRAIQERGGKVVVIDPRQTETADVADAHYFIRPSADVYLLLAWLNVLYKERSVRQTKWQGFARNADRIADVAKRITPEQAAPLTGLEAHTIRRLAHEFYDAPTSVLYGRMGICTTPFGGMSAWLINLINAVAGRLDHRGGAMFPRPALDILKYANKGHYDLWRSRVRDLPEFGGELPVSTLAEEIQTPGEGQIKGLMTVAGNPVLSSPNGGKLDAALAGLDFMVSLDIYRNETTRHAHIILPGTSPLERDSFGLAFHGLAIRDTVKYDGALFDLPHGAKHEWQILLELSEGFAKKRGGFKGYKDAMWLNALRRFGPKNAVALGLRLGPYGVFKKGLNLKKAQSAEGGIDLGALKPSLPEKLLTPDKTLDLVPEPLYKDLERLEKAIADEKRHSSNDLLLIGRRHLRSNNSWLHNSKRLHGGARRCTVLMHPEDAARYQLKEAEQVQVISRTGRVVLPVEMTKKMMPGVVSIPHGWGHERSGVLLQIAQEEPGISINDLTDEKRLDPLTGNAGFNGVPVRIEKVTRVTDAP